MKNHSTELDKEQAITLPLDVLANMARGKDMPNKAKTIFTLLSVGMKRHEIARTMGLSVQTVKDYIRKYDGDGCIVDAINARKMLMAGSFEAIAMTLATSVTPSELDKLSTMQKITIAEKCLRIAREIGAVQPQEEDDQDSALERLRGKQEMEEEDCDDDK